MILPPLRPRIIGMANSEGLHTPKKGIAAEEGNMGESVYSVVIGSVGEGEKHVI